MRTTVSVPFDGKLLRKAIGGVGTMGERVCGETKVGLLETGVVCSR